MPTSPSAFRRIADRLASPTVVGLPIAGAVVGSVMLLSSVSGAALPTGITMTASTPAQSNVAGGGSLTGLHSGDTVNVHVAAASATDLSGITRIAICKPGVSVQFSADLIADQGGNCTDQPLAAGTDASQQDITKASNTDAFVDGSIKVGTGSRTFTWDGGTATITCDSTHPCDLWVQVATNLATDGSGAAFERYAMTFAAGTGSTSTTQAGGSTTSTTASGGSTTSTTAVGGSTTSTTASGGSTTSTTTGSSTTSTSSTLPSGTTVSPTAQAGGSIAVTSTGWKAGTTVKGTLQSDPIDLGTLTVDPTGKITGTYAVPASVPAGAHTLTLSGTSSSGTPRTVTAGVTITAVGGSTTSTSTTARTTGGGIPVTGGNALRVGLAGALLAGGGYLFVLSSRQRRSRYGSAR